MQINNMNNNLQKLIFVIEHSLDEDEVWDAILEIGDNNYLEAMPILLGILKKGESNKVVNAAALALKELGSNVAVAYIVDALNNTNITDKGTLCYALEDLDCSDYVGFLVGLFINEGLEARMSIYNCLEKVAINKIDHEIANECVAKLKDAIKTNIAHESKEQLEWLLELFS